MSKRSADTPMGNSDKKKRKRLSLSIAQKVKLLKKLDNGVSVKHLTEEYGVGTTTIYDLKKQKDKLLKFYAESFEQKLMKNRKTLRKGKSEELERVLMEWIRQCRSEHMPLNGMLIMKQAKIYHDELKIEGNCEYSAGWLTNFKKRHGIKSFHSTQQENTETSEDSEVEVTIEGNMAQVGTAPPVIQEEPSSDENLLAVKFLLSALESMCQEIAKSKAEVACIAVYKKDIFVVGTERGKSFIGNRMDFQTDFVKYCVAEEKKAAQKRGNKALPCVTPTAKDNQADIEKIRKSVEDMFCSVYAKAVGKSPIPVPYEKIFKDPAVVGIQGLPDGVCFKHPSKYETTALKNILEQKSKMIFTMKRPFLNTTIQHVERKQLTGKENAHMPPSSFVGVQVKTEPRDDNQPSTSDEPIPIKAEAEDPDYYRHSVQVETEQPTGKENAHMPPDSFVAVQVKTEPCDDNQPSTSDETIPFKAEAEDPGYFRHSFQGTSVEPIPIKAEAEDPDYYRHSVQGVLWNEAHVSSDDTEEEFTGDDSTQQENSETSEDPEVEVTIEDDEYFLSNKRPKTTVQTTDAGASVKRKSREFNFEQRNARITDLRKQVEELFERKYGSRQLF